MKNLIKHFRRWNIWRKRSLNNKLYKFLVLFGVIKSPTMATVFLPEEIKDRIYFIEEPISEVRIIKISTTEIK